MYTPSAETQRAMLEIPLESNDDLQVISSQTVTQIFEHNPRVINIEKTKSLHYDYTIKPGSFPVNNKGPIGVNIGSIQKEILKPGKTINSTNSETGHSNSQINTQYMYNPPKYDITQVTSSVKEVLHHPSSQENNVPAGIFDNVAPINQLIKDRDTISFPWFQGKQKDVLWPNRETSSMHHTNIAEHSYNVGYGIYDDTKNNKYETNTFNTWFNEQAKLFPELKQPGSSDIINISMLKKEILKIIEQNNMIIGEDSLVRDLNGALVDMRNMKLRRIVIEEKTVTDYNGPLLSLDGIMITLVYPPRILGIIPLRKTYFSEEVNKISQSLDASQLHDSPKPVQSTQLLQSTVSKKIETSQSVQSSKPVEHTKIVVNKVSHNCEGSICNEGSLNELPASGIITEKTKSTTVVNSQTSSQNIENKNENANLLQKRKKQDTKLQMRKQSKNDDSPFKFVANMLDTYKLMPIDQISKLVNNFISPFTTIMNQSSATKEETHEKIGEDDYPDFRIIGGHAATASGAPLITRGRSGSFGVKF
ncbi:uncharacterized protein LOC131853920 [Achroia grisella]|uniref:uncharacterized protein LOC131853920 n=1 Tax=Achroia grisella TaxID=688607 RepID=UPI0027D2EB7D|nr:uncharacterized protein LOC131853920 [Achroia grisella]